MNAYERALAQPTSASSDGSTPAPGPRDLAFMFVFFLVLLVAFSPVLADLAHHLRDQPWARPALVFVPLAIFALRSRPSDRLVPDRRWLWIGLVVGLAIEVIAVGGGIVRIGRLGLAIALVGSVVGLGRAGWRAALVLVFAIPVPRAAIEMLSPWPETILWKLSGALVPGVEAGHTLGRQALVGSLGRFEIFATDGGLSLAVGLAGIGWFLSCERRVSLGVSVRSALVLALAAIPLQVVTLLVAAAILAWGAPGAARAIVDHAPLVFVSVAAVRAFSSILGPHAPDSVPAPDRTDGRGILVG